MCKIRCGSRCPAVTQAVTKAEIAIRTVVAVNIDLALRYGLVYPAGILEPVEVEILPERGGTHTEHSAPVLLHRIQCTVIIAGKRDRAQRVVAEECRIAVRTADRQQLAVYLLRVAEARAHHERCSLL